MIISNISDEQDNVVMEQGLNCLLVSIVVVVTTHSKPICENVGVNVQGIFKQNDISYAPEHG